MREGISGILGPGQDCSVGQRRDYGSYEDYMVQGYSDGTFRPKDHMSRQEGAMLSLKEKK
ncbi:S-layer homology domain-containing protein [Paenibacillus polymyxa]|jgi:hypothetical protein|uniref:S-layer homology domain-containing protein n=1 Tax=Paenibacillus TaxID=44249 RepID=UPI000AC05E6F|nr:hypothetical protein [Paenibacillus polymyxa]